MPSYRVFRLKENLRQQFRWAPHLSGITGVKPKDYEEAFAMDAPTPYALWHAVKGSEQQLEIGDLVESAGSDGTDVRILKYIGFEEARWILPEPKGGIPVDRPYPDSAQPAQAVG